jgi:pyruvoyl-dependent arginine decarboxylase (PvlArgDC)
MIEDQEGQKVQEAPPAAVVAVVAARAAATSAGQQVGAAGLPAGALPVGLGV